MTKYLKKYVFYGLWMYVDAHVLLRKGKKGGTERVAQRQSVSFTRLAFVMSQHNDSLNNDCDKYLLKEI